MNGRQTKLTLATAAIALLATALFAGAGCIEGTEGEQGNFTFHDATAMPGEFIVTDQRLRGSLAEGAELKITVRDSGRVLTLTDAISSNPSIVDIVGVEGNAVIVRGVKSGTARLTVEAGSVSDSLTLTVDTPAISNIHLYPVGDLMADVPGLNTLEVVLTPGARIWGYVRHLDGDGQQLLGHGSAPCTTDAEGARLANNADDDRFTLDAPDKEGNVVVHCGRTQLTLPVESPDVATRLDTYDYLNRRFTNEFENVKPNQSVWIVVIARDKDGFIVQGTAGLPVEFEVPAEHEALVTQGDHSDNPELAALLEDNRVLDLLFSNAERQYTVTAKWNGLTLPLTFFME